jgi:XTP/dITP diphosphohydrolase
MRLYAATTNPGKLRDFAHVAEGWPQLEIAPLEGLAEIQAPAEDEPTFAGNARLKAMYYSRYAPGKLVIADDSGLEVDCLEGAPGVRSARYAEDLGFDLHSGAQMDARNNAALLHQLMQKAFAGASRTARYRCVLALALDGEVLATADGTVEGEILTAPRGEGGFGYDPLFWLPESGLTMAEVDMAARLEVSHRGRALRKLLEGQRFGE